jgi:hypothetical protein
VGGRVMGLSGSSDAKVEPSAPYRWCGFLYVESFVAEFLGARTVAELWATPGVLRFPFWLLLRGSMARLARFFACGGRNA